LFLIFINDIITSIRNCKFLLYADDLKVFTSINTYSDCLDLQNDLDKLFNWSQGNLKFHINKCSVMRFSRKSENNLIVYDYRIGGELLETKKITKDLGIVFDEKLSFVDHVLSTCRSAFSIMGFIRRSSNFLGDIDVIKLLYCSLVRSRLEFGAVIWNPYYC